MLTPELLMLPLPEAALEAAAAFCSFCRDRPPLGEADLIKAEADWELLFMGEEVEPAETAAAIAATAAALASLAAVEFHTGAFAPAAENVLEGRMGVLDFAVIVISGLPARSSACCLLLALAVAARTSAMLLLNVRGMALEPDSLLLKSWLLLLCEAGLPGLTDELVVVEEDADDADMVVVPAFAPIREVLPRIGPLPAF